MAGQLTWTEEFGGSSATGAAAVVGASGGCGRRSRLSRWRLHVINNRTSFGFTFLLILIHGGLMAARAYQYRQSCLWVVIARASGQCLHFDCAVVLLLTLRKSITWLRNVRLGWLLPLDRHIYFHKMIGWAICILSIVHTAAHVVNFHVLGQETGVSLSDYMFDTAMGIGWFHGTANPSGIALLVILAIMATFSHRVVRKSGHFEIFYWTHLLCIPFYTLLILHGPSVWKWISAPLIIFTLEITYRFVYVCSGKGRSLITSAAILPNQVVKLRIERPADFDFQPGDYVFVNVPQVAHYEWHPFTVSSAPENEDYLTLHVRVAGGWTSRLYSLFEEDLVARWLLKTQFNKLLPISGQFRTETLSALPISWSPSDGCLARTGCDNLAFQPEYALQVEEPTPCNQLIHLEVPINLDGPYNGSSARVWNCRQVLLIAGGIGITPFASLLQSLVARYRSSMKACPHCGQICCTSLPASLGKLQHVDFMWINRDLLSFQWFLELLMNLDQEQSGWPVIHGKFLDIQLYQTGSKRSPDVNNPLRCTHCLSASTLLTENSLTVESMFKNHSGMCKCMSTLNQVEHLLSYGRPVWDEVFSRVASKKRGRVTVFYCGPPAMGRVISAKCRKFGFGFSKEIS